MNRPALHITQFLKRKLATTILVGASICAFATLGDDGKKNGKLDGSSVLLPYSAKSFSLRSNYNYRGNLFFHNTEKRKYITLNPTVTYQKGNAAYVLPLKKMPLMGKIRFTCAPQR